MEHDSSFYNKLALRWAPVNYQYIRLDTKNGNYNIKKDLIVPVNLEYYKKNKVDIESSWDTRNIRERLRNVKIEQLIPVAYYSVAETESHYFILYSFYHGDDDTHPNDMEGCLVLLEKQDDSEILLGMVTVAHYDFWKYSYKNNLQHNSGKEFTKKEQFEVDEELDSKRSLIQQEKGKHGLYALGTNINIGTKIILWFGYLLNIHPDVIVFYPNDKAAYYKIENITKGKDTPYNPSFYYELVDILDPVEGIWGRWKNKPNSTFDNDGKFHGGSANPPWLWKLAYRFRPLESNELGFMWLDPVKLVTKLFKPGVNRKDFSPKYIRRMDGTVLKNDIAQS
jgi:hypothetical protein